MSSLKENRGKIMVLCAVVATTIAIHYGWVFQPLFGHQEWVHALHRRFCYIPIVIGAAWFGLRGGLATATAIALLVIPYIYLSDHAADPFTEYTEIIFYYALAVLSGWLFDRELSTRRRHQQAQLELERAKRLSLVGQLAAGVAHEIKNPLASIQGAADIVCDPASSDSDRQDFSAILRSEVKRIDSTVGEFLAFARPPKAVLARLDWSRSVDTTLKQFQRQAEDKRLTISTHIDPDMLILADASKLHQVLLNLLLNAAEATSEGGTIAVTLRTNSELYAELIVEDSGSGMNSDDQARIFEPFFTTKSRGSGLGLAVVKSIIDEHRGTIQVRSQLGRGTSITISIPAEK
jgi:signal transduction histidine kinase